MTSHRLRGDVPSAYAKGYSESIKRQLETVPLTDKLKCKICKSFRNINRYSNRQLDIFRNAFVVQGKRALTTGHATCRGCTSGQVMELRCCVCDQVKGLDEFAINQRKEHEFARCLVCVQGHKDAEPVIDENKLLAEGDLLSTTQGTITNVGSTLAGSTSCLLVMALAMVLRLLTLLTTCLLGEVYGLSLKDMKSTAAGGKGSVLTTTASAISLPSTRIQYTVAGPHSGFRDLKPPLVCSLTVERGNLRRLKPGVPKKFRTTPPAELEKLPKRRTTSTKMKKKKKKKKEKEKKILRAFFERIMHQPIKLYLDQSISVLRAHCRKDAGWYHVLRRLATEETMVLIVYGLSLVVLQSIPAI